MNSSVLQLSKRVLCTQKIVQHLEIRIFLAKWENFGPYQIWYVPYVYGNFLHSLICVWPRVGRMAQLSHMRKVSPATLKAGWLVSLAYGPYHTRMSRGLIFIPPIVMCMLGVIVSVHTRMRGLIRVWAGNLNFLFFPPTHALSSNFFFTPTSLDLSAL